MAAALVMASASPPPNSRQPSMMASSSANTIKCATCARPLQLDELETHICASPSQSPSVPTTPRSATPASGPASSSNNSSRAAAAAPSRSQPASSSSSSSQPPRPDIRAKSPAIPSRSPSSQAPPSSPVPLSTSSSGNTPPLRAPPASRRSTTIDPRSQAALNPSRSPPPSGPVPKRNVPEPRRPPPLGHPPSAGQLAPNGPPPTRSHSHHNASPGHGPSPSPRRSMTVPSRGRVDGPPPPSPIPNVPSTFPPSPFHPANNDDDSDLPLPLPRSSARDSTMSYISVIGRNGEAMGDSVPILSLHVPDTESGGSAGRAGVGRRAFAAVAQAALIATSYQHHHHDPHIAPPRSPISPLHSHQLSYSSTPASHSHFLDPNGRGTPALSVPRSSPSPRIPEVRTPSPGIGYDPRVVSNGVFDDASSLHSPTSPSSSFRSRSPLVPDDLSLRNDWGGDGKTILPLSSSPAKATPTPQTAPQSLRTRANTLESETELGYRDDDLDKSSVGGSSDGGAHNNNDRPPPVPPLPPLSSLPVRTQTILNDLNPATTGSASPRSPNFPSPPRHRGGEQDGDDHIADLLPSNSSVRPGVRRAETAPDAFSRTRAGTMDDTAAGARQKMAERKETAPLNLRRRATSNASSSSNGIGSRSDSPTPMLPDSVVFPGFASKNNNGANRESVASSMSDYTEPTLPDEDDVRLSVMTSSTAPLSLRRGPSGRGHKRGISKSTGSRPKGMKLPMETLEEESSPSASAAALKAVAAAKALLPSLDVPGSSAGSSTGASGSGSGSGSSPPRTRTKSGPSRSSSSQSRRHRTPKICVKCNKTIEDGRWIPVDTGSGGALSSPPSSNSGHSDMYLTVKSTSSLSSSSSASHGSSGDVLCEKDWKEMYLPKCRRCGLTIESQAVSSADGQLKGKYHRACFNCTTCHKPFPDKEFYVFAGQPYCDYHYHVSNNSLCAAPSCRKPIEGPCAEDHEGRRYHPEHLTCAEEGCSTRLVEYFCDANGKMFCERHGQDTGSSPLEVLMEESGEDEDPDVRASIGAAVARPNRDSEGVASLNEKRRTRFLDLSVGASLQ